MKYTLVLAAVIAFTFLLIATGPAYADEGSIRPGETLTGSLGRSDDQLDDDCYYDTYVLDCEIGTLVTITQTSDEIDSYLIVVSPRGTQWDNDDYSYDTGLDSRVTLLANERGQYEINCSSYSPEEGEYDIIVEEVHKPDYYGIFVGIENYGRDFEDAPRCDDDAEALYDSFISSGLMDRSNGIVITNSNAELAQIEDAFDEISRQVNENDVFIFFFSGHGTQVEASSRRGGNELDGLDEAISLRDTDLTDDDFSNLLDRIDASLKVVVLDACNSGGIAPDIVDGPGVVCYASSEEDVLSDFAPELRAGGYLSAFFREAIEGDADLDGDGMIMIGELSHYLLSRFNQEIEGPTMASDGYQELKHERGLVRQDTIFCWWGPDDRDNREKP